MLSTFLRWTHAADRDPASQELVRPTGCRCHRVHSHLPGEATSARRILVRELVQTSDVEHPCVRYRCNNKEHTLYWQVPITGPNSSRARSYLQSIGRSSSPRGGAGGCSQQRARPGLVAPCRMPVSMVVVVFEVVDDHAGLEQGGPAIAA